jgi:AcrR family transcriptional regulator
MAKRTGYHHGDLRNALVEAALELAAERGLPGVSVAEAARRAGVSGGAPYRHFAGRTALLSAAATALTVELLEQLRSTEAELERSRAERGDIEAAIEALAALTRARIEFALHRGLGLELVYAPELRDHDDPERREVTRQLFALYLWPAMTITGDPTRAVRLLRQTAALAQGYIELGLREPDPASRPGALAEEAASAVRTLAAAAHKESS